MQALNVSRLTLVATPHKTGSNTCVQLLSPHVRLAHEFMADSLIRLSMAHCGHRQLQQPCLRPTSFLSSDASVRAVWSHAESYCRSLRRAKLDGDSSGLLVWILPALISSPPPACALLLPHRIVASLRSPHSWAISYMQHLHDGLIQYDRRGKPGRAWFRNKTKFRSSWWWYHEHPAAEPLPAHACSSGQANHSTSDDARRMLCEFPLAGFLGLWRMGYEQVLNLVPPGQLMLMRIESLSSQSTLNELTAFLGLHTRLTPVPPINTALSRHFVPLDVWAVHAGLWGRSSGTALLSATCASWCRALWPCLERDSLSKNGWTETEGAAGAMKMLRQSHMKLLQPCAQSTVSGCPYGNRCS